LESSPFPAPALAARIKPMISPLSFTPLSIGCSLFALFHFDANSSLIWLFFSFYCFLDSSFAVRVDASQERDDQWVEVISWEPRASVYHNFLVSNVWVQLSFLLIVLLAVWTNSASYLSGDFVDVWRTINLVDFLWRCKSYFEPNFMFFPEGMLICKSGYLRIPLVLFSLYLWILESWYICWSWTSNNILCQRATV